MKEGLFFSFEGCEGGGKTTAMSKIKKELELISREVVSTTELDESGYSQSIRSLIFDEDRDVQTEAALFASARREHLNRIVIPQVGKGNIVLCDRFVDSSYAYQSGENLQHYQTLKAFNSWIVGDHMPDLTFIFDLDPEVGLERIRSNNREVNRIDLKEIEFHKTIRENYLKIMADGIINGETRYVLINAEQKPDEIVKDIMSHIKKKL